MKAFSVEQLGHSFGGQRVLDRIDFSVEEGERVAIVGPSGAGKSTLLNLISGAFSPKEGRVNFPSAATKSSRHLKLGMIYQHHHLIENLAVVHNINVGNLGRWSVWKSLLSLVKAQGTDEARAVLKKVGLDDKLLSLTKTLSGGEQQRVAIARLLIQNPNIVLADEPVASVDPKRAESILELLCSQKTIVASLHDVDLAKAHFDRIIGLRAGRIIFDQPAGQVDASLLKTLYHFDQRS